MLSFCCLFRCLCLRNLNLCVSFVLPCLVSRVSYSCFSQEKDKRQRRFKIHHEAHQDNKTTQHTTKQGKTRQDKTKEGKTRKKKTRPFKARRVKTRPDKTRHDMTHATTQNPQNTKQNTTQHKDTVGFFGGKICFLYLSTDWLKTLLSFPLPRRLQVK